LKTTAATDVDQKGYLPVFLKNELERGNPDRDSKKKREGEEGGKKEEEGGLPPLCQKRQERPRSWTQIQELGGRGESYQKGMRGKGLEEVGKTE